PSRNLRFRVRLVCIRSNRQLLVCKRLTREIWAPTRQRNLYGAARHANDSQLRREWPRMQNRTPPGGAGREPGVKTGQAVDDFLLELAPLTMRGKELQKFYQAMGAL